MRARGYVQIRQKSAIRAKSGHKHLLHRSMHPLHTKIARPVLTLKTNRSSTASSHDDDAVPLLGLECFIVRGGKNLV